MFIKRFFKIWALVFFIHGCATFGIQPPDMGVINGRWETTSPYEYGYLLIDGEDNSFFVVIADQKTSHAFRLHEFEFSESDFSVKFSSLLDDVDEKTFTGILLENKLLLISSDKDEKHIMPFVKEGRIDTLRELAKDALSKLSAK